MLHSPKKRSWPSCMAISRWKVLRQPLGDMKGKSPSKTSTRAIATQRVLLSKPYFLAGAGAGLVPPRNDLKNSDPDGSSTITSPLLLKLALYASRLR